jgi:short-subunit dehydrogenase
VERIGQTAMERFGRIDTWVNNAGVGTFGRLEDISLEDHQRLFQTNFWGVVNGSLEAVKRMKLRGGGALINVGSEVSDAPVPLQGMYSASKHAVKAFTESLRMELQKEEAPMSVSLIKPAAIDTMFAVHAKNYMDKERCCRRRSMRPRSWPKPSCTARAIRSATCTSAAGRAVRIQQAVRFLEGVGELACSKSR